MSTRTIKLASFVASLLAIGLLSAHAGPTLGVRTGLQLWLSADAINPADPTQVQIRGGNNFVTRWLDQSSNNFHAVQATADRQPILFSNNGLSILRFDGVNDHFTTSLPQVAGDKSIFVVHRRIGTIWRTELGSTTGSTGFFFGNNLGQETSGRLGIAHDFQVPGLNNAYVLKGLIRSGANATMYLDDVATTLAVPDAAAGSYTVSAPGSPFFGAIAEILIYNRAVTETERQHIESYLAEKYPVCSYSLPVRNGARLWLAADAINTGRDTGQVRTDANGTFVPFWPDRAMQTPASQTTPSRQPRYIANAINGRPALRFDGFDDNMSTPLSQIVGDKTIFVVSKRNTAAFGMELASSVTTGMFLGGYGGLEGKARWGIAWDLLTPGAPVGTFNVKSWTRSAGIETLRYNDTPLTTTVPDFAAGRYQISSTAAAYPGEISEVIIYDRALGATDRRAVEDYLFEKYSHAPDDMFAVPPDLTTPTMTLGAPAPGVRVRQTAPEYAGTNAYHTLYLPTNWVPGTKYPVLVEFPGNGDFVDIHGERHSGLVQDCQLGFGITEGRDYIWVCLPTIGGSPLTNQTEWWGDLEATKDYCLRTVRRVCEEYGGDPAAVILTGFSRGSIACNYVGLADDNIADTWLAFIPHSHYDGIEFWGYPNEDVPSAAARLQRLKGRWQHISRETTWLSPESFIRANMADVTPFTIRTLPYANHTDSWVNRPLQLRRAVRSWLQTVIATRPGTYAISGRVTTATGDPVAGARIDSGFTHFTTTDANGNYVLAGLINSARSVTVTAPGLTFTPAAVTVAGSNVANVDFAAAPPVAAAARAAGR